MSRMLSPRCLPVLVGLLTLPVAIRADVPPRTAGGQALQVPEAQLDRGEVFHILPGGDTQILVKSDAPLLAVAFTCNRVVGYVVAPFDREPDKPPLLAGALRFPIVALRSGMERIDDQIHGLHALNHEKHQEVTAELKDVRVVKMETDDQDRKRYELTARGVVNIKGKAVTLERPIRVLFAPFEWGTMQRGMGDLAVITARFEATVEELNLDPPPQPDFGASTLRIELHLVGSTVSPEENLRPDLDDTDYIALLKFLTLARDFDDPRRAYAYAEEYLRDYDGRPDRLRALAAAIISEEGIRTRDLNIAERALKRANELTGFADPECLGTLATLHFKRRAFDEAVKWARAAVEHLTDEPSYVAGALRARLEEYEHHTQPSSNTADSD